MLQLQVIVRWLDGWEATQCLHAERAAAAVIAGRSPPPSPRRAKQARSHLMDPTASSQQHHLCTLDGKHVRQHKDQLEHERESRHEFFGERDQPPRAQAQTQTQAEQALGGGAGAEGSAPPPPRRRASMTSGLLGIHTVLLSPGSQPAGSAAAATSASVLPQPGSPAAALGGCPLGLRLGSPADNAGSPLGSPVAQVSPARARSPALHSHSPGAMRLNDLSLSPAKGAIPSPGASPASAAGRSCFAWVR
jgi:hypothetical protein